MDKCLKCGKKLENCDIEENIINSNEYYYFYECPTCGKLLVKSYNSGKTAVWCYTVEDDKKDR